MNFANFWKILLEGRKKRPPQVDNQKIERLMKGGFLFGFTASDLFILLASILALLFLQLQPYLSPFLETEIFEQFIESGFNPPEITEVQIEVSTPASEVSTQSAVQKEIENANTSTSPH